MRFSADQMHYAYCVRSPHAYTEFIGCMRKGLLFTGEIIGALHHEEPKPAATAVTLPPSKRFKLSLPVDQRKQSSLPLSLSPIDGHSRMSDLQQWTGARNNPLSKLNNDSALNFDSARRSLEITSVRLIAPRIRKHSPRVNSACTSATHANCTVRESFSPASS